MSTSSSEQYWEKISFLLEDRPISHTGTLSLTPEKKERREKKSLLGFKDLCSKHSMTKFYVDQLLKREEKEACRERKLKLIWLFPETLT